MRGLMSLPLISQDPLKTRLRNRISLRIMTCPMKTAFNPSFLLITTPCHLILNHISFSGGLQYQGPQKMLAVGSNNAVNTAANSAGTKRRICKLSAKCDNRDKAAYFGGTQVTLSSAGVP